MQPRLPEMPDSLDVQSPMAIEMLLQGTVLVHELGAVGAAAQEMLQGSERSRKLRAGSLPC